MARELNATQTWEGKLHTLVENKQHYSNGRLQLRGFEREHQYLH